MNERRKRWRPTVRNYTGKLIEGGHYVETPKIDAFLAEIEEVCRKHGFGISHEDGHGSFRVVDYAAGLLGSDADDCTSKETIDEPCSTYRPGKYECLTCGFVEYVHRQKERP